jgi:hypothetical protein
LADRIRVSLATDQLPVLEAAVLTLFLKGFSLADAAGLLRLPYGPTRRTFWRGVGRLLVALSVSQ